MAINHPTVTGFFYSQFQNEQLITSSNTQHTFKQHYNTISSINSTTGNELCTKVVLQLFSEFLRTINHTSFAGGMSVHAYYATHQEKIFFLFQNQNILPPIIFANLHSATENYPPRVPPDFRAAARRRRQFNAIKGKPINTLRRSTRNCSDKFSDYFPWRPLLLRL